MHCDFLLISLLTTPPSATETASPNRKEFCLSLWFGRHVFHLSSYHLSAWGSKSCNNRLQRDLVTHCESGHQTTWRRSSSLVAPQDFGSMILSQDLLVGMLVRARLRARRYMRCDGPRTQEYSAIHSAQIYVWQATSWGSNEYVRFRSSFSTGRKYPRRWGSSAARHRQHFLHGSDRQSWLRGT